MNLDGKTLLISSYWGYPFGGGEEYLYQSGLWAIKKNMNVYWISFSTSNNKPYDNFSIFNISGFRIIKIPGGFNKNSLHNWIKIINPDIVHHQGHLRKEFHNVCAQLRIPFVTGIHFWNGVVNLNNATNNCEIIKNIENHSINPEYLELINSPYCIFYSVSKFVSECVGLLTNKSVHYTAYSGSMKEKNLVKNNNPIKNKYVTVINIHYLKGGELILYLLEKLTHIPFLLIRTESGSVELDKYIEISVINRRSQNYAPCLFLNRIDDMKSIYSQTRILLAPSIVDETFCRTVNEAMMNGIPVITSGRGNLKYLVGNAGIIIDPFKKGDWAKTIADLYNNYYRIDIMKKKILSKYEEYSEDICRDQFITMISKVMNVSKANNIAIFTPWCDQGLGIQSRNYYEILRNNGHNVHIFSFNPYGRKSAIELQKDPNEWLISNIYYSPNDRENVKDIEIITFIKKYNIGKFIIPETCWFRIFGIAKILRENNVKTYAIPNIEIVRRDEMSKHKYFYKILCNNELCRTIFNKYGITNTVYIGYGISNIKFMPKKIDNVINFIFIGGMNAFSRKHILEICEGFSQAYTVNKSIHLTCTIQCTNVLETLDVQKLNKYTDHPGITLIWSHLTYEQIINLYYTHHVSIQVSKHEGLGLGFYEAVASGTPVITLKTPPHDEIIKDGVNGWLVDCDYQEMTDNPNSFIRSAFFDPSVFAEKILEISIRSLVKMIESLRSDYDNRLSVHAFTKKFISALDI